MLIREVRFDKMSSKWERDPGVNLWFLRITERNINDTIRFRGYIYLNQIYEMLGIRWNPDDKNPCIRNKYCLLKYGEYFYINFDTYIEPSGAIVINIHNYKQG